MDVIIQKQYMRVLKQKERKKGVKNGNNIADGRAFGFFFHLLFVFCAHAKCRLVHVLQRQSDRGRTTRRGIMSLTAVRGFSPFFFLVLLSNSLHMCTGQPVFFFADSNTLTPISRPLAASPSRTCTVACKINSLNINSKPARNQCNLLCFIVRLFPVMLNRF